MFMWIKKNECHSKPKHAEVSLLLFAYYKEGYSAAFASTTCNFMNAFVIQKWISQSAESKKSTAHDQLRYGYKPCS